jgi:hypothetical protein
MLEPALQGLQDDQRGVDDLRSDAVSRQDDDVP